MDKGKRVVITGGGSGIGFEAARFFSGREAQVIIAVRTPSKGELAIKKIKEEFPEADISMMYIDLANLKSVRQFAKEFSDRYDRLDILINNAGIMIPPYKKTADGFELQFGVNHLGHFALTGLLLPLIERTQGSRVVTVSSIANRGASIYFDNLDGSKGFSTINFYRQSKFANLLFGVELNNRLKRKGSETISIVCHPGVSATNLFMRGSEKESGNIMNFFVKLFAQPASKGALPTIFAATDGSLKGGEYIGPDGFMNMRGNPKISSEGSKRFDSEVAAKLWRVSEELTGVDYL
ncbi:MAG: oxidoreductase [Bacteroidales bacterium]